MATNKIFWLGELVNRKRVGEIKIAGKLYAIGAEVPVSKIEKDLLARLNKAGCLGNAAFDVTSKLSDTGKDKDIAMLQGRLAEFEAGKVKDVDRIAELELEAEGVMDVESDASEEIADLNTLIDEMKDGDCKEIADLKADNKEKDSIITGLEKEVKALKKELKK